MNRNIRQIEGLLEGVRGVVGGKMQRAMRDTQGRGVERCRGGGRRRIGLLAQCEHGRQQPGDERTAAHHQSSFTARTTSRLAAAWPLPQAVNAPATITPRPSASSVPGGTLICIVQ